MKHFFLGLATSLLASQNMAIGMAESQLHTLNNNIKSLSQSSLGDINNIAQNYELEDFCPNPTPFVYMKCLANDPSVPPELLHKLAQRESDSLRLSVAANHNIFAKTAKMLAQDKKADVRFHVAANKKTPLIVLKKLMNDEEDRVRSGVAKNPKTPLKWLQELSSDKSPHVRANVAENPNVPISILKKLTKDKTTFVREKVAQNPNTSSKILQQLAQDKASDVRYYVGKHPNTPVEVLVQLSKEDCKISVCGARGVAHNSDTPVKILKRLAQRKDDWYCRRNVALNPKTPASVVFDLLSDRHYKVRNAARAAIKERNLQQ